MNKNKPWRIALVRYVEKHNMVREHTVTSFNNFDAGLEYLKKYNKKPIYLFHKNAVNLHNPMFAMVLSKAYEEEYRKVKD